MTNSSDEISAAENPTPPAGPGMFSGWRLLVMIVFAGFMAKAGYGMFVEASEAKERAAMIGCRSCLKTLGLASRIFATDHNGRYPESWLEITNQIGSGRVFFCSLDLSGDVAGQSITDAISKATYAYRGAGAVEGDAGRVVTFCPHHGHILMTDGEVLEVGRPLTEADFDTKDGKLFVRVSSRGLRQF
jgi:hypothetical protein